MKYYPIIIFILLLFLTGCMSSGGILGNKQNNFIEAARNGKIEIVQDLLPEVEINKDLGRANALMAAAFNEHYEVVVFLVENGANLFQKHSNGWNALDFAENGGMLVERQQQDKPKVVKYLKEQMEKSNK